MYLKSKYFSYLCIGYCTKRSTRAR